MTRAPLLACLAALGGLTPAGHAAPAGPPYTLTDLSTLGGQQSIATGINNKGQVVGSSNLFGDVVGHGYLYSYNPSRPPVGLPGINLLSDVSLQASLQLNSNARSINNSGAFVGYQEVGVIGKDGRSKVSGLIRDPQPGALSGEFGSGVITAAFGINDSGLVVGGADAVTTATPTINPVDGYPYTYAFSLVGPGPQSNTFGVNYLASLGSYSDSAAYGVSPGGKIVGTSFDTGIDSEATLFATSVPFEDTGLGFLGGGADSDAYAATDSIAIGDSTDATGVFHPVAFSLRPVGTVTDLGILPGFSNGVAYGINAGNQIVGNGYNTDSFGNPTAFHGFLYSGGSLYDLNSLLTRASAGNTVEEAVSINDYGQIAADGINVNGQRHAFLLSPTPMVISLSPRSVTPGTTSVQLTVTGTNFAPNAVAYINGVPVPTVFNSGASLTATLSSLPNSGGVTVDVGTPTPGGNGQVLAIGSASLAASIGSFTVDSVNQQYDVTVTLTNTGTVPASNVQFRTGTLSVYPGPTMTSYVSEATTGTGTVTPNGGTETWTLVFPKPALPSGTRSASAGVGGSFTYGASSGTFSASKSLRGITTLK